MGVAGLFACFDFNGRPFLGSASRDSIGSLRLKERRKIFEVVRVGFDCTARVKNFHAGQSQAG